MCSLRLNVADLVYIIGGIGTGLNVETSENTWVDK